MKRKGESVEAGHPPMSLRRHGALWGLARGHPDDQPVSEHVEHLELMRRLDEPYPATPCWGIRRMTVWRRSRAMRRIFNVSAGGGGAWGWTRLRPSRGSVSRLRGPPSTRIAGAG